MAILTDQSLDFISSSEQQTMRLGVRLGELLQPGDFICLKGDLGSGKTMLARGVGRGWGTAIRVTSPTYVLINQYPRMHDDRILYHIDCYRLESQMDVVTAGIEDVLLADGAFMIEWPERITELLPPDRLWIELGHVNETRRKLRFIATEGRATELLKDFRRSAFGV
ncbi:MAG: tRNA (adenosine(37)-N6)-threonylcarbamoyltransferase complex ATPase subunit type 1 TsaE [Candidatus Promineifilaceae bacterium]